MHGLDVHVRKNVNGAKKGRISLSEQQSDCIVKFKSFDIDLSKMCTKFL